MKYKVVEKFVSINGEGPKSGELAVFIRLQGCNLQCSYCDTGWANHEGTSYELLSTEEINTYIKSTKVTNVTLTGGEPLKTEGISELLLDLSKNRGIDLEIETNGSVNLERFLNDRIAFTMDYKLPSSQMEEEMKLENLKHLKKKDSIKFVIGSRSDLVRAKKIIDDNELVGQTKIYFSPVFGKIESQSIVRFMIENNLSDVKMQLQMHKYIWDKDKKGV